MLAASSLLFEVTPAWPRDSPGLGVAALATGSRVPAAVPCATPCTDPWHDWDCYGVLCGYWLCCSDLTLNKAFHAMGLMMKEFNSQLSGTQSHCWGIRLALTRPPRSLGQRVLRLKPGLFPPRWHFCFWRPGIAVKIPSACSGQDNLRLSPTAETWQAHQSHFLATSPHSPSTGRSEGQGDKEGYFFFQLGHFNAAPLMPQKCVWERRVSGSEIKSIHKIPNQSDQK